MRELIIKVGRYCSEYKVDAPEGDLRAVIEDYMCRKLPEGFCTGDLDGRPRSRALTMQNIKANTMQRVKASGLAGYLGSWLRKGQ